MRPSKLFLKGLHQKFLLNIWSSKEHIANILKILGIIVSFGTIISITIFYGFDQSVESRNVFYNILFFAFSFYTVKYIINTILSVHTRKFLSKTILEGLILLLWLSTVIIRVFFNIELDKILVQIMGIPKIVDNAVIFVQFIFFLLVGIDLKKLGDFINKLNIGPSGLMIFSFIFLIIIGSLLLWMPEMTNSKISYFEALFTSGSACCVTGLAIVDTTTIFTFKGKLIIMLLIQLGGINIVSFATFFAFLSRGGSGLKYTTIVKEMMKTDSLASTRSVFKDIIVFTLIIELIGASVLFLNFYINSPQGISDESIFYSIFYSISAFNNAGISLWHENIYDIAFANTYAFQASIMILAFLGGIGFLALHDMFLPSNIIERRRTSWKTLQLNTKIALKTSLALIIFGAFIFYILEYNNSLQHFTLGESIMASFFNSVVARSAGFTSNSITFLSSSTLIMIMFLMFVGASPGSTGGGIKTTTFYLLIKHSISTLSGKKNIETSKQSIPISLINRATTIFIFAVAIIFISIFALSISDPNIEFSHLLFEAVSAFSTVGFSTGLTPELSLAGKVIIMLNMFIGRVGPLTLGFALSKKVLTNRYKYPDATIMIR